MLINNRWKSLMEQIIEDPEGFEEEGGWDVLNTSTSSKEEKEENDEEDGEDTGKEKKEKEEESSEDDGGDWIASEVRFLFFFSTGNRMLLINSHPAASTRNQRRFILYFRAKGQEEGIKGESVSFRSFWA